MNPAPMFAVEIVPLNVPAVQDHIVNVSDREGKLICWCGPYHRAQALECREMFARITV